MTKSKAKELMTSQQLLLSKGGLKIHLPSFATQASSTVFEAPFKKLPFNSSKQTFMKITFLRNIFMCVINKNTFLTLKNLNFKKYVKCSRNVNRNFHLVFHMVM